MSSIHTLYIASGQLGYTLFADLENGDVFEHARSFASHAEANEMALRVDLRVSALLDDDMDAEDWEHALYLAVEMFETSKIWSPTSQLLLNTRLEGLDI